jgi:hypothetical protein
MATRALRLPTGDGDDLQFSVVVRCRAHGMSVAAAAIDRFVCVQILQLWRAAWYYSPGL